jgi:hypothetical protein
VTTVLVLHGTLGVWDEVIVLALGVVLTFVVLKASIRRKRDEDQASDGESRR